MQLSLSRGNAILFVKNKKEQTYVVYQKRQGP
jgi:hypothetical protein